MCFIYDYSRTSIHRSRFYRFPASIVYSDEWSLRNQYHNNLNKSRLYRHLKIYFPAFIVRNVRRPWKKNWLSRKSFVLFDVEIAPSSLQTMNSLQLGVGVDFRNSLKPDSWYVWQTHTHTHTKRLFIMFSRLKLSVRLRGRMNRSRVYQRLFERHVLSIGLQFDEWMLFWVYLFFNT